MLCCLIETSLNFLTYFITQVWKAIVLAGDCGERVASILAKAVPIFALILTNPAKHRTAAVAVNNTWLAHFVAYMIDYFDISAYILASYLF